MGRWKPDARGRLQLAAMQLYFERGFEQTTAAEIAERAGVTERTFFRHFADKREVLFDRTGDLQQFIVTAIVDAPAERTPLDVVCSAMEGVGGVLADRDYSRQRAAIVAANPSLQERELLKMAGLATACAAALHQRGVTGMAASIAAESGVTVFKIGFDTWVGDDPPGDFAACVRAAQAELKGLAATA